LNHLATRTFATREKLFLFTCEEGLGRWANQARALSLHRLRQRVLRARKWEGMLFAAATATALLLTPNGVTSAL